MEDNQMVSAWASRWTCANSLCCSRTEVFFVCPLPLAAFISCSDWNAKSWCRVLDKVLDNWVIFKSSLWTSDSDNAFTIQSPPRAPRTSLGGRFSVTTLTPQSKGDRPYPNPWCTDGRSDKRSGFAAAQANAVPLLLFFDYLWFRYLIYYQSPSSLSI